MEGEEEYSEQEGSFSKQSISKKIAIVAAGASVNIIFGIIVFFILALIANGNMQSALTVTGEFLANIIESLKMLFTGKVGVDQLTRPNRNFNNGSKY